MGSISVKVIVIKYYILILMMISQTAQNESYSMSELQNPLNSIFKSYCNCLTVTHINFTKITNMMNCNYFIDTFQFLRKGRLQTNVSIINIHSTFITVM